MNSCEKAQVPESEPVAVENIKHPARNGGKAAHIFNLGTRFKCVQLHSPTASVPRKETSDIR
jgi:hypothetical protein